MSQKKAVGRNVAIALGIICIVLVAALVAAVAQYTSMIDERDKMIDSRDSDIQGLQAWLNGNITSYQSQISSLNTQISSLDAQVANLQNQISSLNAQIADLQGQVSSLQTGVFLNRDAVSWPTNATIKLYVRNTGTSDATIDGVYAGTSSSNLDRQTSLTYDPPNGAVAAYGGLVSVTIDYSWSTGTTYYFRVVPKVGPPLEFNIKAP